MPRGVRKFWQPEQSFGTWLTVDDVYAGLFQASTVFLRLVRSSSCAAERNINKMDVQLEAEINNHYYICPLFEKRFEHRAQHRASNASE